MRGLPLVIALVVTATSAQAVVRYEALGMSCADIQATIARERVVILKYPSLSTGLPLSDRFVADRKGCVSYENPDQVTIPTADMDNCPVYRCKQDDFRMKD